MTARDHLADLAAILRMPIVWGAVLGAVVALAVHRWVGPLLHGSAYWTALVAATAVFGLAYGLGAGWVRSRRNRVTSSQSGRCEQPK